MAVKTSFPAYEALLIILMGGEQFSTAEIISALKEDFQCELTYATLQGLVEGAQKNGHVAVTVSPVDGDIVSLTMDGQCAAQTYAHDLQVELRPLRYDR